LKGKGTPSKGFQFRGFRSGLTTSSALAALYATVIFIPAIIYLQLVTGQGEFPVAWFMLLLWVKLSELSGKHLTKQEAYLIYTLAGIEFLPLTLVYRAWFRNAPIVQKFGLTNELPLWYYPPSQSSLYEIRTLFHSDWLIPVSLMLTWLIIHTILSISLGFQVRELYMEVENLPFPMEQVNAVAIVSLTSGERRPARVLSIFAIFGFSWGVLLYAFPFVIQSWTGQTFQVLPIPWIDMTVGIERFFPGACFGIATDLIPYTAGLVVPFYIIVAQFLGSLAIYFFGNWMTVAYKLGPDTDLAQAGYQSWWIPGMKTSLVAQRSIMYFWAPVTIGLSLAAGVAPLLHRPRTLFRAITRLASPFTDMETRSSEPVPRLIILLPLILSLVGGVAIFAVLVPDFLLSNLWFIPFMISMPFLSTLISGRMRGEAGVSASLHVGELQNILFILSGYPKADIWFAPNPMTQQGGGWLTRFKVAQLAETTSTSVVKAYLLLLPFTVIVGFLYVEVLWRAAPIPSAAYPGAEIYWPISATYTCLWVKGQQVGLFNVSWIFYSLAAGIGLYSGLALAKLPSCYIGFAAGTGQLPPYATAIFIGGIIGKIAAHRLGDEWRRSSRLVAAGLTMGESIAITISVAISLIINSIWVLPI